MSEHSVTLSGRNQMSLSGVKNVSTFDEDQVILETSLGYLYIGGQDLHVTMLNLDQGQVALEGSINSLEYKELGSDIKTKGKSILNRLLK